MTYNQQAAIRSFKGSQNRAEGIAFEKLIETASAIYADKGVAYIEKTPEPFQVTRSLKNGRFEGYFKKQAQPDFKGTLKSGQSIVFDAKATETEKIPVSALSDEQVKSLTLHKKLGAETGVLLRFGVSGFAWIPFETFMNAKEINGHKHWTKEEAEPYAVNYRNGYLDYLTGRRTDV